MPIIKRGFWKPSLATPNEFHLCWFDPGSAATGWTHFVVDCRAFSRPEHKILPNIVSWNCGEFTGPINDQLAMAEQLVWSRNSGMFRNKWQFGSEDFQLTQNVGGKNLLSPVRINGALDFICFSNGLELIYQNRSLRTQITKEKLKLYGFAGRFRKDEFAAMQHTIIALKRIKAESKGHPWKLSDGIVSNAYWDCTCAHAKLLPPKARQKVTHDLSHP